MVIKFFLTDFKLKDGEKSETENAVINLLSFYARFIGLSSAYLHDIILADDAHFGKAVRSIDKSLKMEKTMVSGSVKAIQHKVEKNVMRCSLVVRRELMELLLAAQAKPPSKWNLEEKCLRYSLMHALGECLDIKNRSDTSPQENQIIESFNISRIFRIYRGRLLREFAASFFAGKGLEPEVYEKNRKAVCKSFSKELDAVNKKKKKYTGDPKQLFQLAHSAAGFFWVSMVHFAGLIGNRLNNEKISLQPLQIRECGSGLTQALIEELEKHLAALWDAYPDWNPKDCVFLLNIWKFLAIENGFKFVESPQGDGVLWQ